MNKRLIALTLVLGGVLLSGCASRHTDAPTPTRFSSGEQQKLQAARHWQLIAEHFAGQMAEGLGDKLNGRALYVPQPGGEQPFVEGFRELLITALVARGLPVATTEAGALRADVSYNIYRFRPERMSEPRYYGQATLLAAGLWAVSGVVAAHGVAAGAKGVTTLAAIEGFDWAVNEGTGASRRASGPTPQSEILLTVSAVDGGRFVSRSSAIYYTADEDVALYWSRPASASRVQVRGY